jgi:RimJ/RimL family protein N-acetyltransferase
MRETRVATIEPRTITRPGAGSIVIRCPRESDLAAWIAYELALFGTDPHKVREPSEFDPGPQAQWARLREHIDNPGCLVLLACPAEEPSEIIGDLMFQNGKLRKMAHQGHFGIAVAAAHRGTGIGRALIATLLDWAAAHPLIEKVSLGVWATNTGAIRMYERAGFREEGRRLGHFRLGPGRHVDDVQMSIWVKPGLAAAPFNTYSSKR